MKRFLWLILLLSLGLNLGLGWRLLSQSDRTGFPERPHFDPDGPHRDRDPDGRPDAPRFRDGTRPAPGDTTAWRRIMEERLARLAERLELDDEQYAAFRTAQEAGFRDFEKLRQRVQDAQRRLFTLAAAEDLDPQAIRDAVAQVRLFRTSLDSLVTETMLKEMGALDPEQRRRYMDIIPWVKLTGGPDGPGGRGGRNGPGGPDHHGFPGPGDGPTDQ